MLIVDRDHRQTHSVSHVTTEGLKVGNDEIDLPVRDQLLKLLHALCRLPHRHQILGDGAFVAHSIVYIRKTKAENFRDVEFAEIAQSTVEGCNVQSMPLLAQVSEHFLRARRVSGTFAIHSIENVGHGRRSIRQEGDVRMRYAPAVAWPMLDNLLPVIAGTS